MWGSDESGREEYWRATDEVIALARTLILRRGQVSPAQLTALFAHRPGFLIRVVDNLGAAACLQLVETHEFDLDDPHVVCTLLRPLDTFAVVSGSRARIEGAQRGIYLALKDAGNGKGTADDAAVPARIAASESPSVDVVNGAMPVIASLITKCISLDDPFAFSPAALEAKLAIVIDFIRCELECMVRKGA